MELSPSREANSHSASQQVPHLLWNRKIHYRIHESTPLVFVLSQTSPFHTSPPYFTKIHFNIICPSNPSSSELSLPYRPSDHDRINSTKIFREEEDHEFRCSHFQITLCATKQIFVYIYLYN